MLLLLALRLWQPRLEEEGEGEEAEKGEGLWGLPLGMFWPHHS